LNKARETIDEMATIVIFPKYRRLLMDSHPASHRVLRLAPPFVAMQSHWYHSAVGTLSILHAVTLKSSLGFPSSAIWQASSQIVFSVKLPENRAAFLMIQAF
jgi:hypothetical protein